MMKTIKDEPIVIPNTANQFLQLYNYDQLKDSLAVTCAWCQRLGSQSFTLHTENGHAKILCSEVCFNQYRRATFKQNKDRKPSKIHQTTKTKSTNYTAIEKRTQHRKLVSPYHHTIPSKSKLARNPSSLFTHPPTLPTNLTSFFLPRSFIDTHRFQRPPPHQLPLSGITTSESSPSTLFSSLTKGLLSNYTCILPTFIPLPISIPIPLCFPAYSPCVKCSIDVINEECQTESSNNFPIKQKQTRRMSF